MILYGAVKNLTDSTLLTDEDSAFLDVRLSLNDLNNIKRFHRFGLQ